MQNTTESQFATDVLALSFRKPVAVLFHSATCAPCRAMKPMIDRMATKGAFTLFGVDAGTERGLATFYSVRAVPTLMVFREGKVTGSLAGGKTEPAVRAFLTLHGLEAA